MAGDSSGGDTAADWRRTLHRLGHRAEERWDDLRRTAKTRLGLIDPVAIVPFRGHGDAMRLRFKARALETGRLDDRPAPGAGAWTNLVRMWHRFESDEVPGARVRARFAGVEREAVADREGYLDFALDGPGLDPDPPAAERWRGVDLELLEPLRAGQAPARATALVLTPPASARFGVISDVDDTILRTGATSLFRNLRTTLLNSAESRSPFHGVAAFYRALEQGPGDAPAGNPVFYVSSSPWNLYDVLERFIALHGIPPGPMFLRDLGLDHAKFIQTSHAAHKLAAIEHLLGFYPDLPFILIGDSGQHDAQIYREAVERHPGRVLAVYIRDLSPDAREPETRALLDEVRRAGAEAVLSPDLLAAAENAAARGWIAEAAVAEVRAEVEAAAEEEGGPQPRPAVRESPP